MEEVLNSILLEQQKTNELLKNLSRPTQYEASQLLSKKDIERQYGLKRSALDKMFSNKDFPAQVDIKPNKVTREAFEAYLSKRHEKAE